MYEVYKWKLGFDTYRDSLPQFYNDYINSYLKFLQMNPSLLLPSSERQLFEQNKLLASIVKEIRQRQYQMDMRHEHCFKELRSQH